MRARSRADRVSGLWGPGLLVAYLAGVLVLTLAARPIHGWATRRVLSALEGLRIGTLPLDVSYASLEATANVLLFVPIGALLTLSIRRRRWWIVPVAALGLSSAIEGTQLMLLPARVGAWTDIVANVSGACIGLVAVGVSRRARDARRNRLA